MSTAAERLLALTELRADKEKEYGDDYKRVGKVLVAMFPQGLHLDSPEDFGRLSLLVQMVTKIMRYCTNFHKEEGHPDSLRDLAVYSQLEAELDDARVRSNRHGPHHL